MKGLLEVNPSKRLTCEQILNHPWFMEFDPNTKYSSKFKINNYLLIATLFTAAELILLSKTNINYLYATKEEIIENFTLKNLETQQENINNTTKSYILAPYNSSYKDNHECSLDKELKVENAIIKIVGKALDANRNYELNNNGEIDNGILINNANKVNASGNIELIINNLTQIYITIDNLKIQNEKIKSIKIFSNPVTPKSELHLANSGLSSPRDRNTLKNERETGQDALLIGNCCS